MFEKRPKAIKDLEIASDILFKMYGGCDNCEHSLCCKIFSPVVFRSEIEAIADSRYMASKDFEKKYLLKVNDKELDYYVINNIPCPFLDKDRCSIHTMRPFACCSFPFEIGMEFVQIHGIELCPTSTLINEEIKDFLEQPKLKLKTVWEVRSRSGEKPDMKSLYSKTSHMYLDPIHDVYKKMGMFELNKQDRSEVYEMNKFLWFLESKGLIFIDEQEELRPQD